MNRRRIIFVLMVVFLNGMIACHRPSQPGPSQPGPSQPAGQSRVVLPNPELLHCRFGECAQMWSTAGRKPGAITPWRMTIERLGKDPCPNGIVALYDRNVSMDELVAAVTEQYGPAVLKFDSPGGIWKDASKYLAISLFPLADEPSPEARPVPDAMQLDPMTYFFTTDAFHDAVGRGLPRRELKQLVYLSTFDSSCGVRLEKPK